ncbi:Cytochrome P450 89A9 [Nymphaea thermarum]|nr:Cytochrome P450 89A9 [Nymphaea thermarum]
MANLVKDRQIQAKLHEEIRTVVGEDGEVSEESVSRMPYLKAVIMEALRKHPPGHFVLPHTVTEEEVSLNGYSVPKDATINFMVGEMGLDGKVWKHPLEFRPERFLPEGEGEDVDLTGSREIKMMPFGAGRRICPGMGLAMLHLQYFVANMVREFEWSVPDGEPVDLTEKVEFTFLNGGTDTTSTAVQWVMANLVKDRQIQAKLHEEIRTVVGEDGEVSEESVSRMPYLKAVIMEALRRHPPGHFVLPHTVTEEEVSLNGYSVPKDATINFMVGEMGLDGKVWKHPLDFRPERFLPGGEGEDVDLTGSREIKMMPFGAGRRICPGMGLALLHLQYFVANMVREFEWSVPDGEPVDLTEKVEFTVVMKNPLRAKIESRKR